MAIAGMRARKEGEKEDAAKAKAEALEALRQKYGAATVDRAARAHSHDFPDGIRWADEIDQHYTKLWLDFTYGGLYTRAILDERTRTLVVVGQFVVMDEMEQLGMHIRAALEAGATPREALEVILQAGVYVGYPKVIRATRVFKTVVGELGRLDEVTNNQLPVAGRGAEASREAAHAQWRTPEHRVARRDELIAKYGWQRLSPGLRLQPTHHVESVDRMDRVDAHFNRLWLDFIYAGMYSRGILDDRTRILCIVGELCVLGELHQAENHIRNALAQGATPREVLEVILHSTIYSGMPRFVRFVSILERALEEEGRLAELTDTQPAFRDE